MHRAGQLGLGRREEFKKSVSQEKYICIAQRWAYDNASHGALTGAQSLMCQLPRAGSSSLMGSNFPTFSLLRARLERIP